MWALLSTRLRTWLFITVVVPILGAVARSVAQRIEARRGSTRLSRALHTVGDFGQRDKGGRSRRRRR